MKKKNALILGISCWIIFALLLIAVKCKMNWVQSFDHYGYNLVQPTSPFKANIMIALTHCGDPIVLQCITILIALILWWHGRVNESLWYVFLQFIGYSVVILVKYNVLRQRPTDKLFPAHGYSFPSGHTFATTVFVLTLLALIIPHIKKSTNRYLLRLIGVIWIVIIMVTRIYLRAHFASDVIGGLLLASGWWLIMNAERHQLSQWLINPLLKNLH